MCLIVSRNKKYIVTSDEKFGVTPIVTLILEEIVKD